MTEQTPTARGPQPLYEKEMRDWATPKAGDIAEGRCTCQRFPTHCANDCPAHGLARESYTAGEPNHRTASGEGPDEAAVERGAKSMWEADEHTPGHDTWSSLPEYGRDLWRDRARACLSASLPASQSVAENGEYLRVAFDDRHQSVADVTPERLKGLRNQSRHWFDAANAAQAQIATLTARVEALEGALRDLIEHADRMPKKTPSVGSCATEHQFTIEAGTVWALDLSVGRARAALASEPACDGGE